MWSIFILFYSFAISTIIVIYKQLMKVESSIVRNPISLWQALKGLRAYIKPIWKLLHTISAFQKFD